MKNLKWKYIINNKIAIYVLTIPSYNDIASSEIEMSVKKAELIHYILIFPKQVDFSVINSSQNKYQEYSDQKISLIFYIFNICKK